MPDHSSIFGRRIRILHATTRNFVFVAAALAASAGVPAEADAQNQNTAYVPPKDTLFIGDSITGDWTDQPIHVGFYGVQACGIRLHFPTVLAQYPNVKRVVIEAGTNDIIQSPRAGPLCYFPRQDPVSSVVDMVKTAKAAGLEVFVMSVLPISWTNQAGEPCGPLVPPLNASLKAAVTPLGAVWVDDYDPFVGHPEYQIDGVHPNELGYYVMEMAYMAAAIPESCSEGVCPKPPPVK